MRGNGRMTMMRHLARICSIIIATSAILTMIAATPVPAQQLGPDGAPNPTASVTSEQKLLQQSPRIDGQIDQPNDRQLDLIQHNGQQCDYVEEVNFHWTADIVTLG